MRTVLAVAVLGLVAGCKCAHRELPMREARLPSGEGTIRVAAAGDISDETLSQQQDTADLVVGGKYDAVLLMGDNQYQKGTAAEFEKYYAPTWGRFKDRTWPTPGNHEYATPNAAGYFGYFGARAGDPAKGYYSFDLGNWHLVALNSNSECTTVPCGPDSEQLAWLRADLEASQKKCTLAYWHHPLFSSGPHRGFEGATAIWNVLYDHGVELVLNGHDHVYERFVPLAPSGQPDPENGIVQITVGTGGKKLYPLLITRSTSAAHDSDTFGILALALQPDGYAFDFVGVSPGTFSDHGEGRCH